MTGIRRWLGRFLPDALSRRIARGATLVVVIQVAGAALGYLSEIVLARVLGAGDYGVFTFVMAWTFLLAVPAGLGLDTALIRIVSEYREKQRRGLLRGATRRGWQLVAVAGTAIAGVGCALAIWGGGPLGIPYAGALAVGIWIVPLRALLNVQVAMSRGFQRMTLAYLPARVLRPALLLAGIGIAASLRPDLGARFTLLIAITAFLIAVLGQGAYLGWQVRDAAGATRPEYATGKWLRISLPMLLIAGFLMLLNRTDLVMLGILADASDVGVYNAASRTANLASFVLVAVNAIAAPNIASLFSEGRREDLQRLASFVAHLSFWPSLVIVAALVLLAPFFLGLFGPEFVAARSALTVLAFAHLVNVGVGSVGYFMNMTGHQDEMARVVGVAAVVNIGLNAVAIPLFGALGAALATGTAMAGWNLWLNRLVVRRLSVRPSIVHAVRRRVRATRGSPDDT